MADNSILDMANDPKRKAKSSDIGWKYGFWPDLTNKDMVQCTLCGKKCHSGIKRLKQHLAGNYGDVTRCPKATTEIMREMQEAILSSKRKNKFIELDEFDYGEEVRKDTFSSPSMTSNVSSNIIPSSGTSSKRKKTVFQFPKPQPKQQNPVEYFFMKTPEEVVQERHSNRSSQTSMENRLTTLEEKKETVHMHIANFFYECGIPFNVTHSRSFEVMVEAIGQYGPGLKPPTHYELRGSLLEKAKLEMFVLRKRHEFAWKQYGCTLILDEWTHKTGRHFINFLVNSQEGIYFMDTIDASDECHDAELLANLVDKKIEEIGVNHVVQVMVADNDLKYKAVGQILMQKRPTLFWTPCAAHCLDLMLEDIRKLKDFKSTITNGKRITTFIYKHDWLLDLIREATNDIDFVTPTVTRFGTTFLKLRNLYKHKDVVEHLFVSDDWLDSKLSTTHAGKQVYDLVLSTKFWNGVENCLQVLEPLLDLLRIVEGNERGVMSEVFAAMEMAKLKIKDSFESKQGLYKKVSDIMERRWETQTEQKLYGAALFLNPKKYFDIKEQDSDFAYKLRDDFNDVVAKMVPDEALLDKISNFADCYDFTREYYAKDMTVRQRKTKNPLDWWNAFGGGSYALLKIANRILGLCCSSSGCERNWNMLEFNIRNAVDKAG